MTRQACTSPTTIQYLAEVFAPAWSEEQLRETCARIRQAVDAVNDSRRRIRYLHAVLVPREETAFFLFEAEPPSTIEHVLEAAGLETERISSAIPMGLNGFREG